MAAVQLQNVTRRFGDVLAVDRLRLEIADGELLVLVGPSGCGKSTTLRMIAGLEEVTDGHILIDGQPVDHLPPRERDIAMVFQNYALYPHMTVEANMGFGLKMRKVPRKEIAGRVAEAADLLDITDILHRRPGQISGGQRQRVAVGRAIVRHPAVFLFDEPLSNLDARLRTGMRSELKQLHQRLGTTMIYVTHDQVEAMTLGDRVVVMDAGRICQAGPPLEIYRSPASRFVAEFLGSPPATCVPASVCMHDGTMHLDLAGQRLRVADSWTNRLTPWVGRQVVAGLRPEFFSLPASATEKNLAAEPEATTVPPGQLRGTVQTVQILGAEALLDVALGDASVIARLPADAGLEPGQSLTLQCDVSRIPLFHAETGAAL